VFSMRKTILPTIFLSILTCLAILGNAFGFSFHHRTAAQAPANPHKVVMIVLPAVSLTDIVSGDLPNLHKLIDHGAIGLMNARTAGRLDAKDGDYEIDGYTPGSAYVTLGAGARDLAGDDAGETFNRDEMIDYDPDDADYINRTLGNSAVANISIPKLLADKNNLSYDVFIGEIGTALHAAGRTTAVVGNADDSRPHREAATICMDGDGLVDFGDVGAYMDILDPAAPLGLRTNAHALIAKANQLIKQADFTVIELGDTARLDRAAQDIMPSALEIERVTALRHADAIIGALIPEATANNAIVVVLSPYQSGEAIEKTGNTLCPVIVSGNGVSYGLLTSGSTRIPGVITNIDIAPSVLAWSGVPPEPRLMGKPIHALAAEAPVNRLMSIYHRSTVQVMNHSLMHVIVGVIIGLVLILTILWLTIPLGHPIRKPLFSIMALIPVAIAPALLLLTSAQSPNLAKTFVEVVAAVTSLIAISRIFKRTPLGSLMLLSSIFAVALIADLLTGQNLSRYSMLGFSIVDGARYYGIGNEFMGAFIGAALVVPMVFLNQHGSDRKTTILVLLAVLLAVGAVIAAPSLGAKAGGTLAIIIAFGCAINAALQRPFGVRTVGVIVLAAVAALGGLAFLDALKGQQASHMGSAISLAGSGGISELWLIIKRKLAMNLWLIQNSAWSKLVVAYVLSAAVLVRSKHGRVPTALTYHMKVMLAGIVAGSIAALVVDDSGIVAAAICLGYSWAALVLMYDL